ncbi:MAG: ubiquinol-cytochrome c reductase iron-sulfur subunit [Vampirovibrionales bacterium]
MVSTVTPEAPEKASCASCPNEGRREFILTAAFASFAALWGAAALFPIVKYLIPREEEAGPEITSVNLGKLDTLPKGTGKNFQFGKKPGLIIRDNAGELHAYSAICSHLGCTVQYDQPASVIFCACHGGKYDPASGKNISGPPPQPLTAFKAEIVNGDIVVSKLPRAGKEA